MSLRPLFLVKIHSIKHYLPKVIKTESRSDLDLCVCCTKVTRVRPSVVASAQSPAGPVWNYSHRAGPPLTLKVINQSQRKPTIN